MPVFRSATTFLWLPRFATRRVSDLTLSNSASNGSRMPIAERIRRDTADQRASQALPAGHQEAIHGGLGTERVNDIDSMNGQRERSGACRDLVRMAKSSRFWPDAFS